MKSSLIALALSCAVGLGCGGDGGGGGGSAGGGTGGGGSGGTVAPTFTNLQALMNTSCSLSTSCHKGTRPKADLNLEPGMAYMELLGDGSGATSCEFPGMKLVVPGDPDASLVMKKLLMPPSGNPDPMCTSAGGKNERMPMSNAALPADKIELFRAWIAAGAKND